ncbi:hypothetical protein ABTO25_20685, partial [Acinetobacter baumannii]
PDETTAESGSSGEKIETKKKERKRMDGKSEQSAAMPAAASTVSAAAEIAAQETARPRVGNLRWTICALLFFAATINYIDRQVIGILKP